MYFKFTPVFFNEYFWWMFFNSVKEINRLRKEINRLLRKGMWNIYLKATIEKNWRFQNFDILGSSNSRRYHWILKIYCVFNFERNCDVLKSKSECILLNKNINFNKNEMESKMEKSTHILRGTNLQLI